MTHTSGQGSWPDLDLRSNYEIDLSRSSSTCFESPWREKHAGIIIIPLSWLVQKLFMKNYFRQKRKFWVWWPLEPKLLTWARFWRHLSERAIQALSIAFFRFLLTIIVSEIMACFRKSSIFRKIWHLMTSGDLNIYLSEKVTKSLS